MRYGHLISVGLCTVLTVPGVALAAGRGAGDDIDLVEAVKNQDAQAVAAALLTHPIDVNVNASQGDGSTALHWAAHWQDVVTVERLLRAGAAVDVASDYGVTPLWLASTNGDLSTVRLLLDAGADANRALPTGETPLMRAARTGVVDVVTALLRRGADLHRRESTSGQTALMWAAAEGHQAVVRALVEYGADVKAASDGGFTALLFAARRGDLPTAQVLLSAGADVNEATPHGMTALLVATLRGHTEFARVLLERDANPNTGPGFAPLHWAAGQWGDRLVGGNRLVAENTEWTALVGLRGDEKVEFIRELLAHGADVNARAEATPTTVPDGSRGGSMAGATPFWFAAKAADVDAMRLLVSDGADPLMPTEDGTTPLMIAAGIGTRGSGTVPPESRALEALKLCVEVGADVNAVNGAGETALHGAAWRAVDGGDSLIQFLVDEGAELDVKNEQGWTPLVITEGIYTAATDTRAPSAAALLKGLGAAPSPPDVDRRIGSR